MRWWHRESVCHQHAGNSFQGGCGKSVTLCRNGPYYDASLQMGTIMKMHFANCVLASVFAAVSIVAGAHAATPKVGVAAAVKNNVQRVTGGGSQQLSVGSDLFTNERIRTGEDSVAQILLLDK